MNRIWGVLVVVDRAFTPDWTVKKLEELLVAELSTTTAPAGAVVFGTALFANFEFGAENAIDTKRVSKRREYILWCYWNNLSLEHSLRAVRFYLTYIHIYIEDIDSVVA